ISNPRCSASGRARPSHVGERVLAFADLSFICEGARKVPCDESLRKARFGNRRSLVILEPCASTNTHRRCKRLCRERRIWLRRLIIRTSPTNIFFPLFWIKARG